MDGDWGRSSIRAECFLVMVAGRSTLPNSYSKKGIEIGYVFTLYEIETLDLGHPGVCHVGNQRMLDDG